ncbi:MAG: carboxylating nicotinate-nucleotide diphosphorylase [Clostridia bacterium]|nr:carboxylating nicotinate-nucleotide diphosphorylase [Clostridia bacterium]
MILPDFYVDDLIKNAVKEDINYIDVATDYLLDENEVSEAVFVAKADGILCGIDAAMRVFELLDNSFTCVVHKKDGDEIKAGDLIAELKGKTVKLLKGERTSLNIIQHMSGIATLTNECVKETIGTRATIADTRKTLPGLRSLQKYAVTCGGGRNHRYNLSDCAMLKDNHIDAKGGITPAVKALREKIGHTVKIEVETRTLDEVREALSAGADIIMLDNMSNETMAEAVKIVDGKALLEASGNLTKERLRSVAQLGVDILSIGALTHSVTAFDISMRMK